MVPPIWRPEGGVESEDPDQTCTKETEVLFEELGLNEPKNWMTKEEVLEAKKLVQGYHMIFSNNPLTYVLTTTKLDASGQRWVSTIAPMNFNFHYKPGRTNIDADALSRLPCSEKIDNDEVQAIIKGCL